MTSPSSSIVGDVADLSNWSERRNTLLQLAKTTLESTRNRHRQLADASLASQLHRDRLRQEGLRWATLKERCHAASEAIREAVATCRSSRLSMLTLSSIANRYPSSVSSDGVSHNCGFALIETEKHALEVEMAAIAAQQVEAAASFDVAPSTIAVRADRSAVDEALQQTSTKVLWSTTVAIPELQTLRKNVDDVNAALDLHRKRMEHAEKDCATQVERLESSEANFRAAVGPKRSSTECGVATQSNNSSSGDGTDTDVEVTDTEAILPCWVPKRAPSSTLAATALTSMTVLCAAQQERCAADHTSRTRLLASLVENRCSNAAGLQDAHEALSQMEHEWKALQAIIAPLEDYAVEVQRVQDMKLLVAEAERLVSEKQEHLDIWEAIEEHRILQATVASLDANIAFLRAEMDHGGKPTLAQLSTSTILPSMERQVEMLSGALSDATEGLHLLTSGGGGDGSEDTDAATNLRRRCQTLQDEADRMRQQLIPAAKAALSEVKQQKRHLRAQVDHWELQEAPRHERFLETLRDDEQLLRTRLEHISNEAESAESRHTANVAHVAALEAELESLLNKEAADEQELLALEEELGASAEANGKEARGVVAPKQAVDMGDGDNDAQMVDIYDATRGVWEHVRVPKPPVPHVTFSPSGVVASQTVPLVETRLSVMPPVSPNTFFFRSEAAKHLAATAIPIPLQPLQLLRRLNPLVVVRSFWKEFIGETAAVVAPGGGDSLRFQV